IDHRQSYLAVDRFVAEGSVIAPADLRPVAIAAVGGLDLVPSGDAVRVVGERTDAALFPGSLLAFGDVSGGGPPPGEALVGTSLSAGELPATLQVGDPVLVVLGTTAGSGAPTGPSSGAGSTPLSGSSPSSAGTTGDRSGVLASGVVEDLVASPSSNTGGSELVTLAVPSASAPAVARASAAGDVSLAQLPAGSLRS
ncbi:MAG: hypothetical protein ACRD0B_02170, partial [Acidimicrobiales bacterium]